MLRRGCRCSIIRIFGNADVASDRVFSNCINHELVSLMLPLWIKDNRLIRYTIPVFCASVINDEDHAELVLFGIGRTKFDCNVADPLRFITTLNGELHIIALAHATQRVDLVMVAGNERTQFAPRHLQIILGTVEVSFDRVNVSTYIGQTVIYVIAAGFVAS
jgi:hypothetical protein